MGFVLWRSVTVLSRFLRARSVARSTSLQDEPSSAAVLRSLQILQPHNAAWPLEAFNQLNLGL